MRISYGEDIILELSSAAFVARVIWTRARACGSYEMIKVDHKEAVFVFVRWQVMRWPLSVVGLKGWLEKAQGVVRSLVRATCLRV